MENNRPFSKLKTQIENLFDPALGMEFCCNSYPMRGGWAENSIPRFYIKMDKQILWDFPADFEIKNISYGHWAGNNDISELVREYIETPKSMILDRMFANEVKRYDTLIICFHLTDFFKAADRRFGKKKLRTWAAKLHNHTIDRIIEKRFGKG
ncbi:MAG: hypothetical protein KA802_12500 [Saprospiraceae bacterium]|nr:hypothetical protein [Saprospiraceae bacterium]